MTNKSLHKIALGDLFGRKVGDYGLSTPDGVLIVTKSSKEAWRIA
jgi:hypothetical protein